MKNQNILNIQLSIEPEKNNMACEISFTGTPEQMKQCIEIMKSLGNNY